MFRNAAVVALCSPWRPPRERRARGAPPGVRHRRAGRGAQGRRRRDQEGAQGEARRGQGSAQGAGEAAQGPARQEARVLAAGEGRELYQLEEAEALAEADYEYRKIDPKGIADSVEDLVESIQGKGVAGRKERIILAPSAAEADLVVEVAGAAERKDPAHPAEAGPLLPALHRRRRAARGAPRASPASPPATARRSSACGPGGSRAPSESKPVFIFESYNGGTEEFGCQGQAANAASAAIDKFIEDNYAILKLH